MEILYYLYLIWALFAGWKFMNGRINFLEQKGILYILLKVIVSWIVGLVLGLLLLILYIAKIVFTH